MSGALVRIEGSSLEARADAQGHFAFAEFPAGPQVLVVSAPDYARVEVEVSAEPTSPLRVELPWAELETAEVEVEATRLPPGAVSTSVLGVEDFEAAPRRNAEDFLRQVPGLTLVQHGSEGKGHQFFLRGFDAAHGADFAVDVEGVPLNEWSNIHAQGYLDLGFILPEMVESIAVQKGPFTLDQGAFAVAGAAHYQLGVPDARRGWRSAYTLGTTNRHRAFLGWSPRDTTREDFVGVALMHDDGYGDGRRIDRASFNGRVLLREGARSKTHALALADHAVFELPGTVRNDDVESGRIGFLGRYDEAGRGRSSRGLLALDTRAQVGDSTVRSLAHLGWRGLDLTENFTGDLLDPIHGDRRRQHQEGWSYGYRAELETPLTPRLSFRTRLGVRGDLIEQREDRLGRELEIVGTRRHTEFSQLLLTGAAGLRWFATDTLQLDAGTRIELAHASVSDRRGGGGTQLGSHLRALPRVGVTWAPTSSLALVGSYGRGFRPADARAFANFEAGETGVEEVSGAGTRARPTLSDSGELGLRWDPRRWFGLSASGFATSLQRESVFDHVSGVSVELNSTRRLGGELVVRSNPLSWLWLRADLTVVDARFVESGAPVPFAPWLASAFHARVASKRGMTAGVRLIALAPRNLPHGARGATMLRTDATWGYAWKRLRLAIEAENLANLMIREGEYHYASHWDPEMPPSQIPTLHSSAGPPFNLRMTLGGQF